MGDMRILITCVLLLMSCEQPIPKCVPGVTVACPCPGGGAGYQVCEPTGSFSACECAAPEIGAAAGGFWCLGAGSCLPQRDLCEAEKRLAGADDPCTWQARAHCYPTVWGLNCYAEHEQCAARIKAREAAARASKLPDRMPIATECAAHDYAW